MMDFPIKILQKSKGKIVSARLKSGIEFKGRLSDLDSQMNILLEEAEEITITGDTIKRLGKAFLRGNTILFIRIL